MPQRRKTLRQVKKSLRRAKVWRAYERRYPHVFRLILTRIALSIDPAVLPSVLVPLEHALATRPTIDETLFQTQLAHIGTATNFTCDWRALARYLFLTYQDLQSKRRGAYTTPAARQAFYAWLHSVPLRTPRYNSLVQNVMRQIIFN